MSERLAIYPGTFDPLTRGHEDLARRAARLFDQLILGVADNRNKRSLFSLAERMDMAREVFADQPNITVLGFSGLLTDFMREQGSRIIVRGLRAVSDFEYEFQMAGTNRRLYPDVETLFLTPDEPHLFLSSSIVREVGLLGGDISSFVHPLVAKHVEQKRLSQQP